MEGLCRPQKPPSPRWPLWTSECLWTWPELSSSQAQRGWGGAAWHLQMLGSMNVRPVNKISSLFLDFLKGMWLIFRFSCCKALGTLEAESDRVLENNPGVFQQQCLQIEYWCWGHSLMWWAGRMISLFHPKGCLCSSVWDSIQNKNIHKKHCISQQQHTVGPWYLWGIHSRTHPWISVDTGVCRKPLKGATRRFFKWFPLGQVTSYSESNLQVPNHGIRRVDCIAKILKNVH